MHFALTQCNGFVLAIFEPLLAPRLKFIFPGLCEDAEYQLTFKENKKNQFDLVFSRRSLLVVACAAACGGAYLYNQHWLANNIIGLCFAIQVSLATLYYVLFCRTYYFILGCWNAFSSKLQNRLHAFRKLLTNALDYGPSWGRSHNSRTKIFEPKYLSRFVNILKADFSSTMSSGYLVPMSWSPLQRYFITGNDDRK